MDRIRPISRPTASSIGISKRRDRSPLLHRRDPVGVDRPVFVAGRYDLTGLLDRQRFHHLLRGPVSLAARSGLRTARLFLEDPGDAG